MGKVSREQIMAVSDALSCTGCGHLLYVCLFQAEASVAVIPVFRKNHTSSHLRLNDYSDWRLKPLSDQLRQLSESWDQIAFFRPVFDGSFYRETADTDLPMISWATIQKKKEENQYREIMMLSADDYRLLLEPCLRHHAEQPIQVTTQVMRRNLFLLGLTTLGFGVLGFGLMGGAIGASVGSISGSVVGFSVWAGITLTVTVVVAIFFTVQLMRLQGRQKALRRVPEVIGKHLNDFFKHMGGTSSLVSMVNS